MPEPKRKKRTEDDSLLLCMEILAEYSYISDKQIAEHLKHNEEVWKREIQKYLVQSEDGYFYIEHQNMMGGMIFGNEYTVNLNGCGAIATYNTFVNLNDGTSPVSFPEILSAYEKQGIVANGALGTSAITVNNYLMKSGYQTEFLSGKEITDESLNKVDENYNAFIIMVYNDEDNVNSSVHFMSVTKEINSDVHLKYCLHNDYSIATEYDEEGRTRYDSINDIIGGYSQGDGAYICVMGINK